MKGVPFHGRIANNINSDANVLYLLSVDYSDILSDSTSLKHSSVTFNVNWRTTGLWALLLRNLPATFPCGTFQDLCQCQLFRAKSEFCTDGVRNAITVLFGSVMFWDG